MNRFEPTKGVVRCRILRLVGVIAVVGVLLTAVPASARQAQDLDASLSVDVVQLASGLASVTVDADLISGRTAKVGTWNLSLVQIIPDDGRGGEGGALVEAVQFGARDLPLGHTFVVEANDVEYYIVLEADARPVGRQRTSAQLLSVSERISVGCMAVGAC